jgi:ribosomal protein S12 methylthiotransferase accessory factor
MSLPRIEIREDELLDDRLAQCLAICHSASRGFEYHFLDATSNLGIPTVYGVQVSKFNQKATTVVACSSASTISEAIAKVISDISRLRPALQRSEKPPAGWADFRDPIHGASFMMGGEQSHHFHFLTQTPRSRSLREARANDLPRNPLHFVLDRMAARGLDVYAVDLSTDEAIRSGMRVVRVLVPGLQPLSLRHFARYLGHPRLFTGPADFGLPAHPEPLINPLPQPFA